MLDKGISSTKSIINKKLDKDYNTTQKWKVGKEVDLIVIGASAGGADALIEVLKVLPDYLPPVLVVQHMEAKFTGLYARRISSICKMKVSEVKDGEMAQQGRVCISSTHVKSLAWLGVSRTPGLS